MTRDVAGRITKHTRLFEGNNGDASIPAGLVAAFNGPTTTYTYSPTTGRLTNFTDPDGSHDVTYDSCGLVSQIAIANEGNYVFKYDALGRNVELDYPGNLVRLQTYDDEGRIVSRCYGGDALTRCYTATYDPAGNPIAMQDQDGTYAFTYDALDRLSSSTRSVTNQSDEIEPYTYNAIGALKTNASVTLDDQRPLLVGNGTADAAVPNTYNNLPVTLDASGRITSLFGNTLAYNRRGRLISVVQPTVNNTTAAEYYGYDSEMRRIGRFGVVNGVPSTMDYELFVWDGANLVASIDKSNNVNESFFYEGVDQPLRITMSGLMT